MMCFYVLCGSHDLCFCVYGLPYGIQVCMWMWVTIKKLGDLINYITTL